MIDVIGINTIQQQLINEIKDAKFHAVMVGEVTSMNDELLSLCFRYVDGQKGGALLSFYKCSGIDIKQC